MEGHFSQAQKEAIKESIDQLEKRCIKQCELMFDEKMKEILERIEAMEDFLEGEEAADPSLTEVIEGSAGEGGELRREKSEVFLPAQSSLADAAANEDCATEEPLIQEFIGTPREKLQWIRDDYTSFEQKMWESYDHWSVMNNNKTVSFNTWMKRKYPEHRSTGYERATEQYERAIRSAQGRK